jgi:hypothetical protein
MDVVRRNDEECSGIDNCRLPNDDLRAGNRQSQPKAGASPLRILAGTFGAENWKSQPKADAPLAQKIQQGEPWGDTLMPVASCADESDRSCF